MLFFVIGGGSRALNAILYTIVADVSPQDMK